MQNNQYFDACHLGETYSHSSTCYWQCNCSPAVRTAAWTTVPPLLHHPRGLPFPFHSLHPSFSSHVFPSRPDCNTALLKSAAVKHLLDPNVISVSQTARTLTCSPLISHSEEGDCFEIGRAQMGLDRRRQEQWQGCRGAPGELDGGGVNCHLLRAFMGSQADIQCHVGAGVGGSESNKAKS